MTSQNAVGPAEVAGEAARIFIEKAAEAIADRGRFTVALSGGSTPERLYRLLAEPPRAGEIDWRSVHVFFGDERCVPPDDARSNYGMARAALLDHVPLPVEKIHRIEGELGPEEAAQRYERTLAQVFGPALPRFDLILLGMGEDGHTASLFPEMPALDERAAWAVGTDVPAYVEPNVPRVTLTFPVLNAARQVLFLDTGRAKAEQVRAALSGNPDVPAARVRPHDGQVLWLLDDEAASAMEQ